MPSATEDTPITTVDVAICGGKSFFLFLLDYLISHRSSDIFAGGPTGLTTALLLQRLGVSVCVVGTLWSLPEEAHLGS